MAGWILIPCLDRLRDDFNEVAPARDKASDGAIGDTAHQAEVSDHNDDEVGSVPIHDADTVHEVHAIDVDSDLRTPGLDMERVVQHLLARCRTGAERRLRYVIYNRRIWRASNGWKQEAYTGPSPHTEHAHFSASYDSKLEASTASWHLEEIPVALTSTDRDWLRTVIREEARAAVDARVGDVVTRWDADGNPLPDSDPNPKMTAASSLGYLARDAGWIKEQLGRIETAVTPPPPPPADA